MLSELSLLAALLLTLTPMPSMAQASVGIEFPEVSIGINFPVYPELVRVPGYPVYYAPRLDSNYFFYDGMYWVYEQNRWYSSSWYNGPWRQMSPEGVPFYLLRVPVRYYRRPPEYFRGWQPASPPRWDEHWGNEWSHRREGWNRWNRGASPPPAPLPIYQRKYSGERYPHPGQQPVLQQRNYRYQPHDPQVREPHGAVVERPTPNTHPDQTIHRPRPEAQYNPRGRPQTRERADSHQPASPMPHAGQTQPLPQQPRQAAPATPDHRQEQERDARPEPAREQGGGQERERTEGRGSEHRR